MIERFKMRKGGGGIKCGEVWHKLLAEQPYGPVRGGGPNNTTPDGNMFCVLELV